jgi:hypothetical protein
VSLLRIPMVREANVEHFRALVAHAAGATRS